VFYTNLGIYLEYKEKPTKKVYNKRELHTFDAGGAGHSFPYGEGGEHANGFSKDSAGEYCHSIFHCFCCSLRTALSGQKEKRAKKNHPAPQT